MRRRLPDGTQQLAVGVIVAGLSLYLFVVLSARALTPARYAALSAMSALVFITGPGLFFPVEQEVARLISARHRGGPNAPNAARGAAVIGTFALVIVSVLSLTVLRPAITKLLDHDGLLLAGFIAALASYFAQHLVRGVLAGAGRFGPYAFLISSEGALRLAACIALFAIGMSKPGLYGIALAVTPLLALSMVLRRARAVLPVEASASWGQLVAGIGSLVAASLLALLLANIAPVAVKFFASTSERSDVGRFFAGFIIVRIPLFLLLAVQATLLPKLSAAVSERRLDDFVSWIRRLTGVVAGAGIVFTAGVFVGGEFALRLFFGKGYVVDRRDLSLLAAATVAYMIATVMNQALVALGRHRLAVFSWFVGVVVFLASTAITHDLFARVEYAFLAGSSVVAVLAAALVSRVYRDPRVGELAPTAGGITY